MVKVDLHTHSLASPDGSLSAADYKRMLHSGRLDVIAVTDHNRIDFAQELQAALGNTIIIGEEIAAAEGEIIGLYLQTVVPPGLTAKETARQVHEQGGLVYIPHPFETARKGLPLATLNAIAEYVDIIEICNGRTMQDRGALAQKWSADHNVPGSASSDAHGSIGWGNTYSELHQKLSRETLVDLLRAARYGMRSTGAVGRLYPKLNRLRKRGRHA
jgi:predicted metal-dependent phosphoesterase TrpH